MQQELRELILQKDEMEKTIARLTAAIQLLDETKDFNKGLVDQEGFPRPDIDFGELANYRALKRRKAELNNDHFALMKVIEQKLFALHASFPKVEGGFSSETLQTKSNSLSFKKKPQKQQQQQKTVTKIDYLTPFAKVSLVSEGSPAFLAGLKVGDLLSEFGEINIYSLDWLKQIPGEVQEGRAIRIVVMRQREVGQNEKESIFVLKDGNSYQKIELQLLPSKWEGRGLLGCKIDPLVSKQAPS